MSAVVARLRLLHQRCAGLRARFHPSYFLGAAAFFFAGLAAAAAALSRARRASSPGAP